MTDLEEDAIMKIGEGRGEVLQCHSIVQLGMRRTGWADLESQYRTGQDRTVQDSSRGCVAAAGLQGGTTNDVRGKNQRGHHP